MKQNILVATTNQGKLAEFRAMLTDKINWLSLNDISDIPQIEEDGNTFRENARKKALGYAREAGIWTLADDSGLVVDALNGRPGVKSARYSGPVDKTKPRHVFDWKNMQKVLAELNDLKAEDRTCRFICSLTLAASDKISLETEGILEGQIAQNPTGENGFGYDPIFYLPNLKKTVAQLTTQEKNSLSHRAKAVRKLKLKLDEILSDKLES